MADPSAYAHHSTPQVVQPSGVAMNVTLASLFVSQITLLPQVPDKHEAEIGGGRSVVVLGGLL